MRIIGLVGWSGAGKTTLITRLIPTLIARGLSVSTLKHAHHQFDVDHPGKDSHEHRLAGSTETLISSGRRFALMHELRGAPEWPLPALLGKLSPVDLVLIEGFKREKHPKIEIYRAENAKSPLHPADPMIRAIATDHVFPGISLPQVGLDEIDAIANLAITLAMPVETIFP
ncbi:MAG: molybdopterin-guanine dinucleotide biosynthesis protein [Beijerinckiaceae bacterium]|nr:MAG: molybdopterin-guanine dinucleotide biosynthesis protein [Beijerinckiaceae bacterium]